MDANPYASPAADLDAGAGQHQGGEVDAGLIDVLARTRPWLRVVGVFLWIGVGLMVLGSIVMLGVAAFSRGVAAAAKKGRLDDHIMLGMALFYLLLAGAYVVPARRLWSAGSAIERLVRSRMRRDLHGALEAQRSFWKFIGVSFVLLAGLYALVLVGIMGSALLQGMTHPLPAR